MRLATEDMSLRERVFLTVCLNLSTACSGVGGAALAWMWLSTGGLL